jgi:proteasome lid subunit RPN8/RPN11
VIAWRNVEPSPLPQVEEFLCRRMSRQPALVARVRDALDARRDGATAGAATPPLVLVHGSAVRGAMRAVSGSRIERGGLLLGSAFQRDGRVVAVRVRAIVAGDARQASALSLRLEPAVWSAANAQLRSGERVVGWFHSHPGIGAFFSATDRRTQAAFFREAYSLGWVIDPLRNEQAWFVGPASQALAAADLMLLSPQTAHQEQTGRT